MQAAFTKEEALAFIDAMRSMFEGRVGFGWYVEKLDTFREYVESTAVENDLLYEFLDQAHMREAYESFRAAS